jgi:hypothetical protein
VTPSRSPKRSPSSPGGVAGASATRTPRPRDDDGDGGIAAEQRHTPDQSDRRRREEDTDCTAHEERQAEQRGTHQPGKERVRQGLGAVGELVEEDPAADDRTGEPDQDELASCVLHELVVPGLDERVHQCSFWWWCAGTRPATLPGRATISPP